MMEHSQWHPPRGGQVCSCEEKGCTGNSPYKACSSSGPGLKSDNALQMAQENASWRSWDQCREEQPQALSGVSKRQETTEELSAVLGMWRELIPAQSPLQGRAGTVLGHIYLSIPAEALLGQAGAPLH